MDSAGNVTQNFYPAYDGNGNVTALIDNAATVVATYRYDAYGNLLSSTGGTTATENPYRFSTKPLDNLTGLYYYGYRFYDPVTGRWPSRDPIWERGGLNLYGMVKNDAVNRWDYMGMHTNMFEYEDPDLQPGGSIAMIRVDVEGKNLCSCEEDGSLEVKVQIMITGTWGEDIVDDTGLIVIEGGETHKFKDNPDINGGDSTFEIPLGRCDSSTGSEVFRIFDLVR